MKLFFKKTGFWGEFTKIVFRISLVTFVVLFITEYLEPGFVTSWFNPIWILLLALAFAALTLLAKKD